MATADSRSLELTWEPPAEENRNGPITGYTVIVVADGRISTQHTTNGTKITLLGLNPFTIYTCSVAANSDFGLSPHSITVSVTTPEEGFCIVTFYIIL